LEALEVGGVGSNFFERDNYVVVVESGEWRVESGDEQREKERKNKSKITHTHTMMTLTV
jgi:hypothetical protein